MTDPSTLARGVGVIMAMGFGDSRPVPTIADTAVVSDPEGAIVVWNPVAERICGFFEAEALRRPIGPDRRRRRHWHANHRTMRMGVTQYGANVLRVPTQSGDGHAPSIAFTAGMLHGADGEVTGIAAVIRDETARWEDERRLRRRISDPEAEMQASVSA